MYLAFACILVITMVNIFSSTFLFQSFHWLVFHAAFPKFYPFYYQEFQPIFPISCSIYWKILSLLNISAIPGPVFD